MSEEKVETPVEGPRGNTIGMRRSYARGDVPSKFVKNQHRQARRGDPSTPSLRSFVKKEKARLGAKADTWLASKGVK